MKLISIIVLAFTLAGCSGVQLNAKYADLVNRTARLSRADADAAAAGNMSIEEAAASMDAQAHVWQRLIDASKGRE